MSLPDKMQRDKLKKDIADFEKYCFHNPHDVFHEYLAFSLFWQNAFITSDYIIYTGNFENVNLEFLYRFYDNIEKHPILWRFFRKVFGV